jgi:hypothetical protein
MVIPHSRIESTQASASAPSAQPVENNSRPTAPPAPIEVISGGMLCRLKIWNDQEWAALPAHQRPRDRAKVPGLGWVGAVPVAGIN